MFPGGIGAWEMVVIAMVAVLLFGSKLPEVARSVGQSYQQFRKGLSEIQTTIKKEIDITDETRRIPDYSDFNQDYEEPTAPKFVPPSEDDDE